MSKLKFLSLIFIAIFSLFTQSAFAQQNNDEGLDGVCDLSGGKWHTSASGWACCWNNWGCYGCTGGNCGMTCRTPKCRKANGMSKATAKEMIVKGLAPQGMKDPIVPLKKVKKHPEKPADKIDSAQ